MSYKAYEILTVQPDFSQDPVVGIGEMGRVDLRIGMKPGYGEWVGTTSLAFRFRYRVRTPEESTSLREFLYRFKGRWAGFYIPSWQQDFTLEAAATVGDTTLTVSEEGFAELTENRPDTEKRVIFALTTDGILQTWNVLGATDGAGSTEILVVDSPVTTALDPETTMMGFCHLVRLADDRQEWTYDAPGQGNVDLRMIGVTHRRAVETEETVESAAIGSAMKAFEDLIAEDLDPELLEFITPETVGPNSYGTTQLANFVAPWRAEFVAGPIVRMTNLDSLVTEDSTLYDSASETDHLAFCFDPTSTEILAWHDPSNPGQIRLRWFESAVAQDLDFQGFAPIAFNTWVIDGTVVAGDAEAAVFYLKPGYSVIFARLLRDSFATEYQMIRSQAAPIYLHKVERNGSRIEIHGMDSGHRKTRWRSETYNPPVADSAGATLTIEAGSLEQIAFLAIVGDGAGAELTINNGSYEDTITPADPAGDGAGAELTIDNGSYENTITPADPEGDGAGAELDLDSGAYTLVAQQGPASDSAGATLEIQNGSYETP